MSSQSLLSDFEGCFLIKKSMVATKNNAFIAATVKTELGLDNGQDFAIATKSRSEYV